MPLSSRKVWSTPATRISSPFMWDPLPLLYSSALRYGIISMRVVSWKAKWDLATGDMSAISSYVFHWLWSWASHSTSLSATIFVCRTGTLIIPTSKDCDEARGRRPLVPYSAFTSTAHVCSETLQFSFVCFQIDIFIFGVSGTGSFSFNTLLKIHPRCMSSYAVPLPCCLLVLGMNVAQLVYPFQSC